MIFNITLALVLFILYFNVKITLKKGYFISIQVIMSFCFLLFILLTPIVLQPSIINDNSYNLLLLFGALGLIFAGIITPYDVIDPNSVKKKKINPSYRIKDNWSFLGFLIFLTYLVVVIILEIKKYGSLTAIFTSNRLENGEHSPIGNLIYLIMLFFRIIYYIHIYKFYIQKKHLKFILLYLIPVIHHQITATTRFDFIIMMIVLILIYIEPFILKKQLLANNTYKKRISTLKLIVIIIPVLFLSSFYMYTANIVRHGLLSNEKKIISTSGLLNSNFATDLSYYFLLNDLYEAKSNGQIKLEYGKGWIYYPFITYIPRAIWKDKPPTAFSTRYTEKLYWKLGEGPVATFTIFGEAYIQFGLLGVILSPLLFAYSRYLSISYLKKITNSKIIILLTVFSMITYFRAEIPFTYVVLDFIYGYIIMKYLSKKIA